jgi:very-short-patch-repair endonuclease
VRAPKQIAATAKGFRQKLSLPEVLLWVRLRERVPDRPAFRRQYALGPYILDFYCPKARLVIEIDGASHDMGSRPQRDMQRDAWLQERGMTVMRVPAVDVLRNVDDAADAIVRLAADLSAAHDAA